jgi:hypothetical protein
MSEKKISTSIITAPRIANGRSAGRPVTENRIQAIRAWESASTKKRFATRQKKAVGSVQHLNDRKARSYTYLHNKTL